MLVTKLWRILPPAGLIAILLTGQALACVQQRVTPPDVSLVFSSAQELVLVAHDYTTVAVPSAEDCAMGLNIPSNFGDVVSAEVVNVASGEVESNLVFAASANAANGFQAAFPLSAPEFWSGFSVASGPVPGGTPVDLEFRIFNSSGPIDFQGLANHVAITQAIVATDSATSSGSPDGGRQSILSAASVSVQVRAFGMLHEGLGQAQFGGTAMNELAIFNIGSSGSDGVRVLTPPNKGFTAGLGAATCSDGYFDGDGLGLRHVGAGSFASVFYTVGADNTWRAAVDLSNPPACLQMQLYDGGELVTEECVAVSTPLLSFPSALCPEELGWLHLPDAPRMRLLLAQQGPVTLGSGSPEIGDEILIFDPAWTMTPGGVYELTVKSSYGKPFYISSEAVQIFDGKHLAYGGAELRDNASGHLVISNIGSSGLDGVRLEPAENFHLDDFFDVFTELNLNPDNDSAAPGSFVEYLAVGRLHNDTSLDPLGEMRVSKTGSGDFEVTADFTYIGANTQLVEVYNNGNLVFTASGQPTGSVLAAFAVWPGETSTFSSGWPVEMSGFSLGWSSPVSITIPDGSRNVKATTVTGDWMRVRAQDGPRVSSIIYLETSISGFSPYTIVGSELVPASDVDDDGVPDVIDNCVEVSNPDQCNTNNDIFGNHCDADLDNNGIVNSFDLSAMRAAFGSSGANDADLDCNGIVNSFDLTIMRGAFGTAPGPSGQ